MRLRSYVVNVGFALAYALIFWWCYVAFLNGQLESFGYDLYRHDTGFIAMSVLVAIAPILCYRGTRALSSIVAVMIYIALYVPIILMFALGSPRHPDEILRTQLAFFIGMCLIFLADAADIRNPFQLSVRRNLMPMVVVLTAASTGYILLVYGNSLSFSSFGDDLYAQRAANEGLGSGLITRYVSSWLMTVLSPLCVGYGLFAKRYRYVWAGAVASLVLYMAAANKIAILLPIASVGLYVVMRNRLSPVFPTIVGAVVAAVAALMVISPMPGTPLFLATAILLNRTIGNGGQITMTYYDFFSAHPQTNYAHVNGLNLLTPPYPYGDVPIGQVVGQFYWSPFMNANANFWATDGIAAIGAPGILVASVACVATLAALNAITREFDHGFVAVAFLPFITVLLNQSLFSSVWSGGAFFLAVFFLFARRDMPRAVAR
jgi:hypothetical protein